MADPLHPQQRAAELRSDRSAGWILMFLLVVFGLGATGMGFVLPFGLDACRSTCAHITAQRFYAGWWLSLGGHWVFILVAVCWMSVRTAAGRPIAWIALAAGGASAVTWFGGWWLALGIVPV